MRVQVTGLSWIADDLLLSVSIDQRVTLWKLTSHNELEATWTTMTAVADVSSLTPLANNRYLLIAGQGQEVIALPGLYSFGFLIISPSSQYILGESTPNT